MRNIFPARRFMYTALAFGFLLFLRFAQTAGAQTVATQTVAAQSVVAQTYTTPTVSNPLNLFKNYFVTGDYVVGGWVEGHPDGTGYAPGTISIPDTRQPYQYGVPASVPKGADIVAAYLYWATVESYRFPFSGQKGFFNGYAIAGDAISNSTAVSPWNSDGCGGDSDGHNTTRTYRADVRPFLHVDVNPASVTYGSLPGTGSISVRLADHGSHDDAPNVLGATLVIIYRVLAPASPLNAVVLYDGVYAPNHNSQTVTQKIAGFYQPSLSPAAKITPIVLNGEPYRNERVYLGSGTTQPLPSIYGFLPPFPGIYNDWDNPTWNLSQYGYVKTADTSELLSVVPATPIKACVTWEAVVFSTTVQDSDGDGLLDIWEDGSGYTDAVSGQWVALPGANKQVKDIFLEVDYLSDLDGSTGLPLHSHLPKKAAIDTVGAAFASTAHPINLHFDLGPRRLFRRSICDQLSGQPSQPASSGNNRAASRDRRQSNF